MKLRFLLAFTLASFAAAQVSVRGPELQMSGSTISHTKTDGNCHVPKSFNQPAGYQLTTNGGSCDLFWSAPGGAFVDSARVAHEADSAVFATRSDSARAAHIADSAKAAPRPDSVRVSGLSDSAKALVRYARTTAVHDTADTLRKYTRDRIHDTSLVLRQRLADTSAALRLALTDPAEVRVIVHDTSLSIRAAIPTGGPFLPLAGGVMDAGATISAGGAMLGEYPLDGNFWAIYGDAAGTHGNSNYSLSASRNGQATSINGAINANLAVGGAAKVRATSTGAEILGSLSISGLGAGVVRSSSAGLLSSSALTYADLTGTVPTWNQSTTGSAATLTTARTLTIGSTGRAFNGSANVSWSLAEIGAQAAGSYLPVNNPTFTGTLTGPVSNVGGMVAKTYSADTDYFTILGDGAAAANYSLTSSRNGAATYVGASTHVGLALSGAEKLYITSAGVTIPTLTGSTTRLATINPAGQVGAASWVAGTDYLAPSSIAIPSGQIAYGTGSGLTSAATLTTNGARITAGVANVGTWASDATVARWGLALTDDASGSGILQFPNGQITIRAPGQSIYLNAGSEAMLDANGLTVYQLAGTGTRELQVSLGGRLTPVSFAYISGSSTTILAQGSPTQQYIITQNPTIILPAPFAGGHFVFCNQSLNNGNSATLVSPGGASMIWYSGEGSQTQHVVQFGNGQSGVRHIYSNGTFWFLDGTDLN